MYTLYLAFCHTLLVRVITHLRLIVIFLCGPECPNEVLVTAPFTGSLATQTFLYKVLINGVCSHERQVIMNNSHALCGWGSDGPAACMPRWWGLLRPVYRMCVYSTVNTN